MIRWSDAFRLRQYVKGSLWILPLLGGLLGLVLAAVDYGNEHRLDLPNQWTYSAGTASGVLTTIVGAMVGLLGFVVTIGVLVVQTATGTLSPRFMRLWYRNRLQKIVLAVFAGTFSFSFTLLRRITEENVPSLGVTIAGLLTMVSLTLLLLYLDHFTHALRPVAVGALVAHAGLRVLRESWRSAIPGPASAVPEGEPVLIPADGSGVVQAVNTSRLVAAAYRHDCLIYLARTPGDFVPAGAPLMSVHGASVPPDLAGLVALGRERTIDQDAAFALRILVDIAIRALSPAVNDPTTAVQMIDQIEVFMRGVATTGHRTDTWVLTDELGTARVIIPARRFETYLDLAMTEILQYGRVSPQVCRRLAAMLAELAAVVDPADLPAVERERERLSAAVGHAFAGEAREFAARADNQGIGGPERETPWVA